MPSRVITHLLWAGAAVWLLLCLGMVYLFTAWDDAKRQFNTEVAYGSKTTRRRKRRSQGRAD
jgi:hypothetical protein